MKNASFRQKLLTSFLAIGILPLLICTLLMLNIFRLSLTRSAADAAETQLDAMSGGAAVRWAAWWRTSPPP